MPISHKHKIIFIHIPKNAGTAITNAPGMDFQNSGHHKCSEYKDLISAEKWGEFFKFSVIRNPWDRVVSNYNYARMIKSYWHSTDGSTVYPKHADYDLCSRLSFEQCVKMLHENPRFFKHMGWGHQHPYIFDSNDQLLIDKIFSHHEMDSCEFKELIPKLEKVNTSTKMKANYKDYYNNKLINLVYEIYKKDITLLNFKFDNNL